MKLRRWFFKYDYVINTILQKKKFFSNCSFLNYLSHTTKLPSSNREQKIFSSKNLLL